MTNKKKTIEELEQEATQLLIQLHEANTKSEITKIINKRIKVKKLMKARRKGCMNAG